MRTELAEVRELLKNLKREDLHKSLMSLTKN